MTKVTLNWALLGSLVAALAGVVGSIVTPIYGSELSSSIENVLQALSGLLVLIPTLHMSSVAASNAKLRAQYRINAEARSAGLMPAQVPGL